MKKFIHILFLILSFYSLNSRAVDFEWEKYKTEGAITIYRAKNKTKSGLVPIKAKTTLNHNLVNVLSALSQSQKKYLWVPSLIESDILEVKNEHEWIEYARYVSPWPFYDRDFIVHVKGEWNEKRREAYIRLKSVEHPKRPIIPKYVRGHTTSGYARVLDLGNNKTELEVMFLTDFKGNIPTWIINMVQQKWPFKMFTRLRKYMEKNQIRPMKKYIDLIQSKKQ